MKYSPLGPRFVIQIGEKNIDYNEEFCLFLTTRNPAPEIPPDAASVVTEVNFTTTKAGLTGQVTNGSFQLLFACVELVAFYAPTWIDEGHIVIFKKNRKESAACKQYCKRAFLGTFTTFYATGIVQFS